jgi:hypothetical protein
MDKWRILLKLWPAVTARVPVISYHGHGRTELTTVQYSNGSTGENRPGGGPLYASRTTVGLPPDFDHL